MRGQFRSILQVLTHTATKLKISALPAGLAITFLLSLLSIPGTVYADINNTRADAWGTLELAGSGWLSSGGVNVYSNGSQITYTPNKPNNSVNGVVSGEEWQCVELVNRLYLTKGWTTATWSGYGNTLVNSVPSGLTKQNDGYISYLNPGDVITLDDGGYGHAGIINSVGSTIQIVNQNTTAVYSSASIASGTSLGAGNADIDMSGWAGYNVQAVIHYPSGQSSWPGVGSAIYSGGDSMASGTTLLPGYYLTSSNVQNALIFQTDSNLVLYSGGRSVWQSFTSGQNANRLIMQTDGNLVMYRQDNSMVWNSNTGGHPGSLAYAKMQDDGNFVIYPSSGPAYGSTGTGGNPNLTYFGSDRLTSALGAQSLTQGYYIRSSDKRYAVLLQTNGDAVLYGPGAHQLWHTNTAGAGDTFTMQTDGNLVLYALGVAKWDSITSGNSNYAVIQSDGNFVVYSSSNFPLWPSGTGGKI